MLRKTTLLLATLAALTPALVGCGSRTQGTNSSDHASGDLNTFAATANTNVKIAAIADGDLTIVNSASYKAGVSPGSFASFFGEGLADSTVAAGATLPTELGGISIAIGTQWVKLVFVSAHQVNFVVPNVAPGLYNITVTKNRLTVAEGKLQIVPVAPGIFTVKDTGYGTAKAQAYDAGTYAAIFNPTTLEARPVSTGSLASPNVLILYGTGIKGRSSLANVSVNFDGQSVPAVYAGPQNQFEGLDQVNVLIPPSLATAQPKIVDVRVVVDGLASNWSRVCIAGTSGAACPKPTVARLVNISGTGQVTTEFYPFGEDLFVRAVDSRGLPIDDVTIGWSETTTTGVARVRLPTSVTNLAGVASMNALANTVLAGYGYGMTNIRATVAGTSLAADYKLSVTARNSSGTLWPISSIESLSGIRGSAGALLPAAVVMQFAQSTGAYTGQAFPNLGLRIYVDASGTEGKVPSAICENGVDEVGTVLSDTRGVASCDVRLGAQKASGYLKIRSFGANVRTQPIVVQ